MQRNLLSPLPVTASTLRHTPRQDVRRWRALTGLFVPILPVLGVVVLWQLAVNARLLPVFILPPPSDVAERLFEVTLGADRVRLLPHLGVTLQAVLLGLGLGVALGFALGYLIAKNRFLENLFSPLIVAFQATPVVAYAPMLVILLGTGVESKVFTAILIVFFPMLMTTIVAIRGVPQRLHDLMRVLRATRWQVFAKLELPAALPVLIGGLKTSATLSVIGAVVGEFVSANAGLGHLILSARNSYDTPLVLVAVFTLTALALSLYASVGLLERRTLRWQKRAR